MNLLQKKIESKIGPLYLVSSEIGLRGVFWNKQSIKIKTINSIASQNLLVAEKQIKEYLKGLRKSFDLNLDIQGTNFQKIVWAQLMKIPYGDTRSYKDIASSLGKPQASRAVGTANGKNPLCLIIPCHRVIASNGSLGGYSGGLDKKRQLLQIEQQFIL